MTRGRPDSPLRTLLRSPRHDNPDPLAERPAPMQATTSHERPVLTPALCELVDAGAADSLLLRIAGRWSPATPIGAELFVSGGESGDVVKPLPPGPVVAEDGLWSVAFAVPPRAAEVQMALVTRATGGLMLPSLSVGREAADGPERRPAERVLPQLSAEERLAQALDDLADANAVASQLRRRCELSERGLNEFRDKLIQAWGEAGEVREMLDAREAAHVEAKQRERAARTVVAEVERRALGNEAQLAERRDELEQHCARLEAELKRRASGEPAALEQHAAASEQASALQLEADEALTRFRAAHAEGRQLAEQLEQARAVAEHAASAAARAEQELSGERERSRDAARQADLYGERLAKAERERAETQSQLDAALARVESLAAEVAELTQALEALRAGADASEREIETACRRLSEAAARIEALEERSGEALAALKAAHAEAAQAREAIAAAEARADAGEAEAEALRDRLTDAEDRVTRADAAAAEAHAALEAERRRADEVAARADGEGRRADGAECELVAARERLAEIEAASAELAASERALHEELTALTQPLPPGDRVRRGALRRSKVAAHVYAETLYELEVEHAERARIEQEAAALASRVAQLEELEATTAAADQALAEANARLEAANARVNELSAESHCAAPAAGDQLERERARREHFAQVSRQARAEADAARQRAEQASAELEHATGELATARARVAELEEQSFEALVTARSAEEDVVDAAAVAAAEAARAAADLDAERARADEQAARAEAIAAELGDARARLEQAEEVTGQLAVSEQALRQELDALTRTDVGEDPSHGLSLRRNRVSTRAYRESLAKLEDEQARRAAIEQDASRLGEQVRQLELALAARDATRAQASVEADLRHLLSVRQAELDEARATLKEQSARYAAVASQVPVAEAAAVQEAPREARPWTAVDDDLLARLARAKELAGQD